MTPGNNCVEQQQPQQPSEDQSVPGDARQSEQKPSPDEPALRVLVDADACPVKAEVYKVAARYQIPVVIVANSFLRIANDPLVSQVVVSAGPDAADDYIAEQAGAATVVVTADILLADRCLKVSATVLAPNGRQFTDHSIGAAIATRAIMADLRAGGDVMGGPPPFVKADRSRFLGALDEALVRLQRNR